MKLKEIKQKIKQFDESIKIENWLPDYKINKKIFQFTFGFLLIFFGLCLAIDNPQQMRYINIECDSDNPCINQFYQCNAIIEDSLYLQYPICQELDPEFYTNEYLQPHEKIGDFPPFYLKYSGLIFTIVILCAFIINHFKENTKRSKKW